MSNAVDRLTLLARVLLGVGVVTLVLGLSAMYGAELAEEPAGSAVGAGFVALGATLMALGALARTSSRRVRVRIRN